ncbi:hypothetical protein BF28_6013 (plasmid) [Bacillus cereus E33L]|nr:hypothetical protein BF28_6013 [Bacillus cereus E33L]
MVATIVVCMIICILLTAMTNRGSDRVLAMNRKVNE